MSADADPMHSVVEAVVDEPSTSPGAAPSGASSSAAAAAAPAPAPGGTATGGGGGGDGGDGGRDPTAAALKVLLTNDQAGAVIGKGGSEIRALQAESGARVKIASSDEVFPGTSERVALITGPPETILACTRRLYTHLHAEMKARAEDSEELPDLTCRVVIPENVAGLIIGRGGENIQAIAVDTGARLKLSSREHQVAGVPERVVSIVGDLSAVLAAVAMVYHKMQEDPERAVYTHKSVYYNQLVNPMSSMLMSAPGSTFPHGYGMPPYPSGTPGAYMPGMTPGAMPVGQHTIQIAVPDSVVGAIVGKGGKSLQWLQHTTGTHINLSARGEFVRGTTNRTITITGTMAATQQAQALITQKAYAAASGGTDGGDRGAASTGASTAVAAAGGGGAAGGGAAAGVATVPAATAGVVGMGVSMPTGPSTAAAVVDGTATSTAGGVGVGAPGASTAAAVVMGAAAPGGGVATAATNGSGPAPSGSS